MHGLSSPDGRGISEMRIGFAVTLAGCLVLSATGAMPALAQDRVGVSSAVNQQAMGTPPAAPTRQLVIGQDIIYNERITTSDIGQTELLFLDASALTIAPSSDVTIDQFVFDPKSGTGKLAMTATRGLLRFVGGKLSKQEDAVSLRTGTATMAVRGGAFLLKQAPNGFVEAIFIYGHSLSVTGRTGASQTLRRPGYAITVAGPGALPSEPHPVPPGELAELLGQLDGRPGANGGAAIIPTDPIVARSGLDQTVSGNLIGSRRQAMQSAPWSSLTPPNYPAPTANAPVGAVQIVNCLSQACVSTVQLGISGAGQVGQFAPATGIGPITVPGGPAATSPPGSPGQPSITTPILPPGSPLSTPTSPSSTPTLEPTAPVLTPTTVPVPITTPAPAPVTAPAPAPAPVVVTTPISTPAPSPTAIATPPTTPPLGTPMAVPAPVGVPISPAVPSGPTPTPLLTPTPSPTPVVTPAPAATPVVVPTPVSTPTITPVTTPPVPATTPTAVPALLPTSAPAPVVVPAPTPTPVVTPAPGPTPVVAPTPAAAPVVSSGPSSTPVSGGPVPIPTPVPSISSQLPRGGPFGHGSGPFGHASGPFGHAPGPLGKEIAPLNLR